MTLLALSITTPERVVFKDEVESVTLPTQTGEITVLPHHVPLVAVLRSGAIQVRKAGVISALAISGGFIEVQPDRIVVLADTAERSEEIDEQRAEEARQRAQKLLEETRTDHVDYAALQSRLEKELARLHVARRFRKHSSADHLSNPDRPHV